MGLFGLGKKAVEVAADATTATAEKSVGLFKKIGQKLGGVGGAIKKAVCVAGAISLAKNAYDVYAEMKDNGKSFTQAVTTPSVHQATEASDRDKQNARELAPEPTQGSTGTEAQATM